MPVVSAVCCVTAESEACGFLSYKFSSAELNYPTGEQELLAVITALRQWRCHLEGAEKVVVVTDHKPNTFLDSKPSVQLSRRQVHWQQFLSRFDFHMGISQGLVLMWLIRSAATLHC